METYCAICGVGFGVETSIYNTDYNEDRSDDIPRMTDAGRLTNDDVMWTYDFVALRRRPAFRGTNESTNTPTAWYISGIGVNDGETLRAPPVGCDARQEKEEQVEMQGDYVLAYTNDGNGDEVVFPMHPICWDLFLQNFALAGKSRPNLNTLGDLFTKQDIEYDDSGNGRSCGMRPNWMPDHVYGEVELFWGDETSGWSYLEEPWASQIAWAAWDNPQLDYLVHDPAKLPDFRRYFQNPPLLDPTIRQSTRATKGADGFLNPTSAADPFSVLPTEICIAIFCCLPTRSVNNLRLASRSMAVVYLTPAYWRSRFEWPNELCHIKTPVPLRGEVDWRLLCSQVLHSPARVTEFVQMSPSSPQLLVSPAEEQGVLNRRRILRLTQRLVERLLAIDNAEST